VLRWHLLMNVMCHLWDPHCLIAPMTNYYVSLGIVQSAEVCCCCVVMWLDLVMWLMMWTSWWVPRDMCGTHLSGVMRQGRAHQCWHGLIGWWHVTVSCWLGPIQCCHVAHLLSSSVLSISYNCLFKRLLFLLCYSLSFRVEGLDVTKFKNRQTSQK
jgi:hypothetical protein